MRVTILYRGVPVGVGNLEVDGEVAAVEVDPLPGYAAIQPAVRDAWRALLNHGYLPPGQAAVGGVDAAGDAAGREAFDRAVAVWDALELRDERGRLIPTKWVQLTDGGEGADVSLMAKISITEAAAPARLAPHPRRDADAAPPAA